MYDIFHFALNVGMETFSEVMESPYIPWDLGYLYDSVSRFNSDIGTAMGVGVFAFIGMTVIYVAIRLISSLFK